MQSQNPECTINIGITLFYLKIFLSIVSALEYILTEIHSTVLLVNYYNGPNFNNSNGISNNAD